MNQRLVNLVLQTYEAPFDVNAIWTFLNTKSIVIKDSSLRNFRDITRLYGDVFAATILGKLEAAGASNPLLKATYYSVCNNGLDFSHDITQAQLEALKNANVFTSTECTKLKEVGIKTYTPLEHAGITTTLAELESSLNEYVVEENNRVASAQLVSWWSDLHNVILPGLQNGTLTKVQAKDLVQGS